MCPIPGTWLAQLLSYLDCIDPSVETPKQNEADLGKKKTQKQKKENNKQTPLQTIETCLLFTCNGVETSSI